MGDIKALAESTRIENPSAAPLKKPAIAVMLLSCLYVVKDRRGVTLQWIRKMLERKYEYTMVPKQYTLLKKKLRELQDTGSVAIVSGKGLRGRMCLDKSERIKIQNRIKMREKQILNKNGASSDLITPDENIKIFNNQAFNAPVKKKISKNLVSTPHKVADSVPQSIYSTTPVSHRSRFVEET